MNIVIINQPLNNRGDEAAHKSLMRALVKKFPKTNIYVIFQGASKNSIEQIKIYAPNVSYINLPYIRGMNLIRKYFLVLGFIKVSTIFPCNFRYSQYIKKADLVINAPGGICMGLFQNWEHIYWLSVAKVFKKQIVYYSRSFGPFPENTFFEKKFQKISLNLLQYFDFLSIRDSKTMYLADQLKLSYIPSIDTAFLDVPDVLIPMNIIKYLTKPYIVFVPNSLTWHPAYKLVDQNIIDGYYIEAVNAIKKIYNDYTIVMLPQLYNRGMKNDKEYFQKLSEKMQYDNLIVFSDSINSDIQQKIIAGSEFVIGSRYHSVVFAINNNRPVIALSYEHKISGLLQILNFDDFLIDFEDIIMSNIPYELFVNNIIEKIKNLYINREASYKARHIAENCMNNFVEKYRVQY